MNNATCKMTSGSPCLQNKTIFVNKILFGERGGDEAYKVLQITNNVRICVSKTDCLK